MIFRCRDRKLELVHTYAMAVVNVTPDSFSDGGKYLRPEEAAARARNAAREGAAVIDLGGESTRPGATPLAWADEWARLEPVFDLLARDPLPGAILSVDTYHPETARRALAAGAHILNCVYAGSIPAFTALAAETGCGLILPARTPQAVAALRAGLPAACAATPDETQVMVDPEIGFGTTREEDVALLGSLRRLAASAPVCVGVSRKRLIKRLTGERTAGKNLGGCVGAAVWCALNGASLVRVHDVAETVQALRVAEAFAAGSLETENLA